MSRGGVADFDALVAEADSASVDGWDFGWLDGRGHSSRTLIEARKPGR